MSFGNLFEMEGIQTAEEAKPKSTRGPSRQKKAPKSDERGCDVCPLNKIEGIQKIFGKVEGKSILIIAQSPGPDENDEGEELVGKSGQFLWNELAKVGIKRKDCDIQNTVRCLPADVVESSYDSYLKMREPTTQEIKCCSIHTEAILPKIKAKQILIFGQVAAKAFLRTRSKSTEKIFWHEGLQARVYILDHPSYFIRGYAPPQRLKAFQDTLALIAQEHDGGKSLSDPFAYVKEQDYRLVTNAKEAKAAAEIIRKYGYSSKRVAVDIEDAPAMDCPECGRRYIGHEYLEMKECPACHVTVTKSRIVTACGFCPKPGLSFVFVLWQKNDYRGVLPCIAVVKELLEDPKIKKCLQYGCSDDLKLQQYLGIHMQGFDHDTNLSEYLRFPDAKSYGLDKIVDRRFVQFSGYWNIIAPDIVAGLTTPPEGLKLQPLGKQYDWLEKNRCVDMSKLSLEALRLYNGADCHVTKLIELSNKKHVPQALLQIYIDLSYILRDMESTGPLFDYEQSGKLAIVYPYKEKKLLAELREMIGDPDFNPSSPKQVLAAMYEKLDLDYPGEGKPNTKKNTMLVLGRKHPFPKKVLEYRGVSKALGTYIEGYRTCADLNDGRLRTSWWSTGTRTGRLSSSGGGKGRKDGINLQNIHGDAQIQNTCISDRRWKKLYKAIAEIISAHHQDQARHAVEVEVWVKERIPDLKIFLVLDYGQVEVRVAAQLADDKNLLEDCQQSDIHTAVGCVAEGQRVLTDYGLIPIEAVTRDMLVWDGVAFVVHGGVVCQGVKEVMTYADLTATPDHEVWDNFGRKRTLANVCESRLGLAVTGAQDIPIRYPYDNIQDCAQRSPLSQDGVGALSGLQWRLRDLCGPHTSWTSSKMPLHQDKVSPSWRTHTAKPLCRYLEAMQQSTGCKLRRAGHTEQICISGGVCKLCAARASSSKLQKCDAGSDKQRWPLRTRKFTAGHSYPTSTQQTKQCAFGVQRASASSSRVGLQTKNGLPFYKFHTKHHLELSAAGSVLEDNSEKRKAKAKVYDILNCGPRHRFTVEGHLVANCTMTGWDPEKIRHDKTIRTQTKSVHFGILFGSGVKGVHNSVVARTPEGQEPLSKDQIADAMQRYFARYKGIKAFIEHQREFAKANSYVETIFGMKQPLIITGEREPEEGNDGYAEEEEKHGAWWGNQCINNPVQGSAHQLLECGLVNLRRKPKKYAVLNTPVLDVHDALYFRVNVLDLPEAYAKARYLMEQESLNTVKSDFPAIKWKVPIVTEAEAGMSLGCKIEIQEGFSVGKLLIDWYHKRRKQIITLNKELAAILPMKP